MPSFRPTIEDVAEAAGVSKSTVSRVLNGVERHIRPSTRARVLEAIERLQYRPSSVARSLISKQTRTVGILISDINNPYYPDVVRGIEDVALNHDYNVFLCNTDYDAERGLRLVRSLIDKNVDGVLLMSSSMSDEWLVELARNRVPSVVIDWEVRAPQLGVHFLTVDFYTGIQQAVDHLVGLGHRRLAHVSGPLDLQTSRRRRDAFLASLAQHDIDPQAVSIIEGNLRMDGGRRALSELLADPHPPTAVFAANDLTALGLISAARAHGVRIPDDLSICGVDNIWLAAETDPPLTTIDLPRYAIGTRAMELLLHALTQPDPQIPSSAGEESIETQLIVRESTGRPPHR